MSGSVLEKYTRRVAPVERADAGEAAPETADDFGSFGLYRGVRDRAIHLELIKRDGNILAPGYAWIDRMQLDPSGVITLHTGGQKITITGRNLGRASRAGLSLFSALVRHRVPWIREADGATAIRAQDEDTFIERIDW